MKVIVFSTRDYDRSFLGAAAARPGTGPHQLQFVEAALGPATAPLAAGFGCACLFVNDRADADVLSTLAQGGTRLLALRSAGFNHVDLAAAERLGLTVLRVPAYSPHAIAEHTLALMLCLNRKLHRAFNRVREHNFALDGLMGFDLNGKNVGIVGTGRIGALVARMLGAFGCRVLASDLAQDAACLAAGVQYVPLAQLLAESDVVSLHCPLTPQTRHLIDQDTLAGMRRGVMLVNTSRGAVIDTVAAIEALKSGQLGSLAIDVYEEEGDLFFRDLSERVLTDDVLARLLTFPNVLLTAHQGFFTHEAMSGIAATTLANIDDFERGSVHAANRVTASEHER